MSTAAKTGSTTRIFAHPKDVHCVIYHLLSLAAYALAFWLYLNPEVAGIEGPWSRVAFVIGAAIMLGWISGIDVGVNFHNHTHKRIFKKKWLNDWFGRIWTFSGGWPSFFWQHAHVTVHHANVLGETDWTLPYKKKNGQWEGLYRYSLLHWPFRYTYHLFQDFKINRGGPKVRQKSLKEFAIFMVLWSIPFIIDPLMGLGLWLLPHYLANVLVMGPGMYAQHAGCDRPSDESPYTHSNTFTSKFFNLTMFNIGYHIEHHTFPHLHWSELPAFHEQFKDELINRGGHVVPYGYYRAGRLLCDPFNPEASLAKFREQHPDYVRKEEPAEEPVVTA